MEVRLAATQALTNALEFASTNFSNETERNYLMQARGVHHRRILPAPQPLENHSQAERIQFYWPHHFL